MILGYHSYRVTTEKPKSKALMKPDIPTYWEMEKRGHQQAFTIQTDDKNDLNTNFEPPQPWNLKPVGINGKIHDEINLDFRIKIYIPLDFAPDTSKNYSFLNKNGETRVSFYVRKKSALNSVYTYSLNATDIDIPISWKLDRNKQVVSVTTKKSHKLFFSICRKKV